MVGFGDDRRWQCCQVCTRLAIPRQWFEASMESRFGWEGARRIEFFWDGCIVRERAICRQLNNSGVVVRAGARSFSPRRFGDWIGTAQRIVPRTKVRRISGRPIGPAVRNVHRAEFVAGSSSAVNAGVFSPTRSRNRAKKANHSGRRVV